MLHTALMITYDQVEWLADKEKSFDSETWPGHSPVSERCRTLQQVTTVPRSFLTWYLTLRSLN